MGNSKSEEEKFLEDFDKFYQNPRYIAFDDNGNLFYGELTPYEDALCQRYTLRI